MLIGSLTIQRTPLTPLWDLHYSTCIYTLGKDTVESGVYVVKLTYSYSFGVSLILFSHVKDLAKDL